MTALDTSPQAVMRRAWAAPPDWVEALAVACTEASQSRVAKRLGVSPGLISAVLHGRYQGDLEGVELRVRGTIMAARVLCPLLGDIALAACLEHQERVRAGARGSEVRIRLARTCPGCPNFRGQKR